MTDKDHVVPLMTASHEIEAAAVVARLEAEGIEARQVGELTSGFRAEAPGFVQILVRRSDLARAQQIIENI